jgi:integrase
LARYRHGMASKTLARIASRSTSGEIVTVRPAGAAVLPKREGGRAVDRVSELTGLIAGLVADGSAIDQLAYRKSLEARAPASVKALANDLACYAAFCARNRGPRLPASPARLVAYLEDCEARRLSPATVGRRLATMAVVHGLLGVPSPTSAPVVRDALRGFRRRVEVRQRQAGPLRFGEGIGITAAKGFTLTALLEACPGSVTGLRDAALLSLGYDAGLRVSELVAIDCGHITQLDEGAGMLDVVRSKTDQEGRGAQAWLSPDTMRRIALWLEGAAIPQGPLFRRIAATHTRARASRRAIHISELAWNAQVDHERMAAQPERLASVEYMIGEDALTPAAVRLIIKRRARQAAEEGLVNLFGNELDAAIAALSTHSLRVGLTQDLFANGEDAGPIAQALRWTSTATALRYGRNLAPEANATARMLAKVRR